MHPDHAVFVESLASKHRVRLTFFSKEDRTHLVRTCAPMDFGPSRRAKDGFDRYHFWDFDSDSGSHVLSLLPNQIVQIAQLEDTFDPAGFVTWTPAWFLPRDWGQFS
jgi:hypothetical protein